MTPKPPILRRFVFDALLPFEAGRARRRHLEDVLSRGFEAHRFGPDDRRFGTFLAYGVLRHWFVLSAMITGLSRVPLEKLEPRVRLLLRMGLFQLAFMESVPDFAAVSSTLELASALQLSTKSRGFINALLQTMIRRGKPIPDTPEAWLPAWWRQRLVTQHGPELATEITQAIRAIPMLSIRVNTLKTTLADYQARLTAEGIPFEPSADVPELLWILTPQGDPRALPGFADGLFLVQDESSARVARFLDPQPGEFILEIGAAPGTKTTHMAALMRNQGRILAVDSAASRMDKLTENLERLAVTLAEPRVAPGETLECPTPAPDRVLIDAPCSGTGTLGKHPEILLALRETDFTRHPQTQLALLTHGFACLKPGGTLVYSTCSIDATENQAVIAAFLAETPTATLQTELPLLPTARRDGFYMARLAKS